jgi:putative membrane protein
VKTTGIFTAVGRRWLIVPLAVAAAFMVAMWAAPAALAHGGIDSGQEPWTAWNRNPLPTVLVLLAAYVYLNGLSNWERPSHPVNTWQKASFLFGLFLVFFALQSPLDALSDHLLSFHQMQHFILRMVAPMFILLGAPLTPMLRGLPPWARQGIIRPLARNYYVRQVYGLLTNPIFTVGFFLGSLYLWQFPGAFNLALRNDEVHALMHLTMSVSGFLFWWVIIDPPPHRSRLHYGLRVLYLGLIVLPNTLLGAAITFREEVIYLAYQDVPRPWEGLSSITDQRLGGLMLWVPGDMMSVLSAGIVMMMWYQREMAENPNPPMPVPATPAEDDSGSDE